MKNIKNVFNNIPTLFDYINNLNKNIESNKLFCCLFKDNNSNIINEENFKIAFNNLKKLEKSFNIGFKHDRNELYEMLINSFIAEFNINREKIIAELVNFGINSGNTLTKNILNNIDKLKDANIDFYFINDLNIDFITNIYNNWKQSDDYNPGNLLSDKLFNNIIIVYNCVDPSNYSQILTFPMIDSKNKTDINNYLNCIKMEWSNNLGINFYNARIILEDDFFKKAKEELLFNIFFTDTIKFNSIKKIN